MPRSDVKISVLAAPPAVSRRRSQLRGRLELAYVEKAQTEGLKVTQAEMEQFSFFEESRAQLYHLSTDEVAMLRNWVYDKGLAGLGDKEKLEEIYKELGLDSMAIARRGKVDNKIVNILRTKREHERMFMEDDNAVVAGRLAGLIEKVCSERNGFFGELQATLEKSGMKLEKAEGNTSLEGAA